jgi:D-lyxose ketol-isomerase
MKRTDINRLVTRAKQCFETHGWVLPPKPQWDVTDFGLGHWQEHGLVLINLANETEYCEKLMYAQAGMTTPCHYHKKKKEDIICRWGRLRLHLWTDLSQKSDGSVIPAKINGEMQSIRSGEIIELPAGHRITLLQGVCHAFLPASTECIIGEVSTANDDLNDNFFSNPDIGRFPGIEEDEPALVKLLSDS